MATNTWTAVIGLFIAFVGPMLWLGAVRRTGRDPLSLGARAGLWVLMCAVLGLMYFDGGQSGQAIGIRSADRYTPLIAVAILFAMMAVFALSELASALLGLASVTTEPGGKRIMALPLPYRIFVLTTAAVVEEVLFRLYPIERLGPLLGSAWWAGGIALVFFVWSHAGTWSVRHLLNVSPAGAVLTVAYIVSRDLVACIAAHVAVDMVGFILVPIIIAKRRGAKAEPVVEGL